MAKPARRVHQRVPCDLPVTVHWPSTGAKLGEGRLIDLSVGGAAFETMLPLQRGAPYELRLTMSGRPWRLSARVAWETPRQPRAVLLRYGLIFTLTVRQEDVVRAMLDELRRLKPPDSRPMRDYWSV